MPRRIGGSLRTLTVGAAFTFLMNTAFAVITAEPSLAAGCTYSGCNGKDPNTLGCSATNAAHSWFGNDLYGWSVDLRYSSGCHAYWTKVTSSDCALSQIPLKYMKIQQDLYTPYGYVRQRVYYKQFSGWCSGEDWTKMIGSYSSSRYNACFYSTMGAPVNPANLPDSSWSCTAWKYV